MSEEETFKRLSRPSFDDLVTELIIEDTRAVREWFIQDVARGIPLKNPEGLAYWHSVSKGWTWEEFVKECRKRINDD